jgi:hypothetical protein
MPLKDIDVLNDRSIRTDPPASMTTRLRPETGALMAHRLGIADLIVRDEVSIATVRRA